MSAVGGGVEFLHLAPHANAVFFDRHEKRHDPLAGDVDDVLGVMEERDGVVVASEKQDFSVELDESLERRSMSEREVPRLLRDQMVRLPSRDDEPRHVAVDGRARVGAEELDERAVVALRTVGQRIEGRQLLQQLALGRRIQMPAPDLVVVGRTARVHHQRAGRRQRVSQREMNLVGPAGDFPHCAHRGVQHHRVAGGDSKGTERVGELTAGKHRESIVREEYGADLTARI